MRFIDPDGMVPDYGSMQKTYWEAPGLSQTGSGTEAITITGAEARAPFSNLQSALTGNNDDPKDKKPKQSSVEKAINWVQDHFEISAGYELSFGAQLGGAVKKGMGGYIDIGSTIHSDVRLSNKGSTGNKYRPVEKTTSGFAAAYFAGVDYEKQSYKGNTSRKVSLGAFGFGGEITWDKNGVTDWFAGFNPAFKGGFGFGVEADFKIGFSK